MLLGTITLCQKKSQRKTKHCGVLRNMVIKYSWILKDKSVKDFKEIKIQLKFLNKSTSQMAIRKRVAMLLFE